SARNCFIFCWWKGRWSIGRTRRTIGVVIPSNPGRMGTANRLTSQTLMATAAARPRSVPKRLTHDQRRRGGSKKMARSDIDKVLLETGKVGATFRVVLP